MTHQPWHAMTYTMTMIDDKLLRRYDTEPLLQVKPSPNDCCMLIYSSLMLPLLPQLVMLYVTSHQFLSSEIESLWVVLPWRWRLSRLGRSKFVTSLYPLDRAITNYTTGALIQNIRLNIWCMVATFVSVYIYLHLVAITFSIHSHLWFLN